MPADGPRSPLTFRPLSPTFGVEIDGLDLTAPVDAATEAALQDAYRRHRLLLVRGQDVTPEQQARFGGIFGEVRIREHNLVKPASEAAQHVSNVRGDGVFGRGELKPHMDQLFFPEPLAALILYAIDLPDSPSETHFYDTGAVLDAMPQALRSRIEGATCRVTRAYDDALAKHFNVSNAPGTIVSAVHPMVWTEPGTGRKAIWCGWVEQVHVTGLTVPESQALAAEVLAEIDRCPATYAHVWRPRDLLLWNNRTLYHARKPFDERQPRTLRRTPILAPAA